MPYGGEQNAEQVAKIERCVQKVMGQGKDKSSAIAICKAQILGGGDGNRRNKKGSRRRGG